MILVLILILCPGVVWAAGPTDRFSAPPEKTTHLSGAYREEQLKRYRELRRFANPQKTQEARAALRGELI